MRVVDAVDAPFLRLSDPKFLDPLAGGARGARAQLVCAHALWHRGPSL